MESPKVGIVILALVAASSLIGGLAGWQMREHAGLPENFAVTAPSSVR